ncbi:MAG TPA: ABC transporter permease, partial [Blastocatellia bacterium]|nr:ABC transporter permease [Blastocatellia bacterium]
MRLPLWRRRRREAELEEELRSHLRMAIRDRMDRGESAEEAESAARREFGNVGLIKETARGMWGWRSLETFWQDLGYGARMLLKHPGFTLTAALTLALGIGANTAIFSVVNALLLVPPVAAQPERLVRLDKLEQGIGNLTSFPNYRDLAEEAHAFSALAAFTADQFSLGQGEARGKIFGLSVTGNYFSTLGVRAALGRTFGTETDGAPGANPVAVMSHRSWEQRFGADPGLVGRTIDLNGHQFTVIGVMPRGFRGALPLGISPEIWTPLTMQSTLRSGGDRFENRGQSWLQVIGRLDPAISPAQAQAEVSMVARRLADRYPLENRGLEKAEIFPAGQPPELFMRVIPVFIGLVTVIAGLVLLIVCANLANLLLARAVLRQQEIAIRLALGASRWRLIRQLLTESTLLALAGGVVGCLLAVIVTSLLRSLSLPGSIPMEFNATVDARVLCFTLAVSLLAGVLFGLAPAWQSSKLDLLPMLKDNRRSGGGQVTRFSLRHLLVISQVAVSLVFLIGAGLFTRSLQQANSLNPGFETEHLLTAPLDLEPAGYDEARGRLFYQRVLDQVERLPGVQSASLARFIPARWEGAGSSAVAVEGDDAPDGDYPKISLNMVAPRYFETMGITVLAGREFNSRDGRGAPPVVVVNETMARRFWPGQSPLGRRLRLLPDKNVFS